MANIRTIQASYVSGEFDPTLLGRIDIDDYRQGADKLRNVYVRPQGGAFRREGLEYFNGVHGNAVSRLIPFQFNDVQTYILVFTAGRMDVYRTDDKTLQATVVASPISSITEDMLSEINWTQSADTLIIVHKDLQPIEVSRTSDTTWTASSITFENIPPFAFGALSTSNPAGTITPDVTTGIVNVTASGTPFTASHVGQFINTVKGGKILITKYIGTGEVNGVVRIELEGTSAIANGDWELEEGYEDVMSASRGWPRSVTFHKSRLVFGGLGSRPQTMLMSKIAEFYDFNIGEGLDDEAIDVTIDDDKVNIIRNIYSGNALTILTSGGEYSVRGDIDNVITPGNIVNQIQKETRHGCSKIRPVSLDGTIIFVEREDPGDASTGRIVRQFVFNDTEQSFNAPNISVFSQHLINDPVAMDIRSSTETHPSNYLYMVNSDGTCAVLNSLREQSLLAWTLFETEGSFEDIAVSGNKTFFTVKRTINGVEVRNLEVLNANNRLDCSIVQTDSETINWSGVSHFNGEEGWVVGDDFVLEKATPSGGLVTTSEAVSEMELGFAFFARIKHLPLELVIQGQTWAGQYKNCIFANVRVFESRDFIVHNGDQTTKPSLEEFATEYTEGNATLYSKWLKVYIGGVGRDIQPEITQEVPLELNVLATHFGVKVS